MFGYVRVYPPQLKVWEHELYKSTYCGLCKYGGKRTTRLIRFLLSYDFVALAVVRMALTNEHPKLEKHFCPYFPKRKMMVTASPSMEYTADAFVILSYYKLLDNKKDTKGIKRIITDFSPHLLKSNAEKAEKRCEGLSEIIKSELERLDGEEKENSSSLDKVADCFSVLLGKILSYGLSDYRERIAYEMGYHMGRYIYILDALDDFKKDIKSGNYNPLVNIYTDLESLKKNIGDVTETIKASLKRVEAACELIENNWLKGIIENIVTYGADTVISKAVDGLNK